MRIIIQSPGLKITQRVERSIIAKFKRLEKISPHIIRCEIMLKKEKSAKGDDFKLDTKLMVPGNDLFARDSATRFVDAAENVYENLQTQLSKHKKKVLSKMRKARKSDQMVRTKK